MTFATTNERPNNRQGCLKVKSIHGLIHIGSCFRQAAVNVRILSELPRGETRERQHCRCVSFDRAVSSESVTFAADAVFYRLLIGLLLPGWRTRSTIRSKV